MGRNVGDVADGTPCVRAAVDVVGRTIPALLGGERSDDEADGTESKPDVGVIGERGGGTMGGGIAFLTLAILAGDLDRSLLRSFSGSMGGIDGSSRPGMVGVRMALELAEDCARARVMIEGDGGGIFASFVSLTDVCGACATGAMAK